MRERPIASNTSECSFYHLKIPFDSRTSLANPSASVIATYGVPLESDVTYLTRVYLRSLSASTVNHKHLRPSFTVFTASNFLFEMGLFFHTVSNQNKIIRMEHRFQSFTCLGFSSCSSHYLVHCYLEKLNLNFTKSSNILVLKLNT